MSTAPPDAGTGRRTARRLIAVDVARAVALFSMYVAHFSPGVGPLEFLELSEYLTAALFATLVGVGADLGSVRRPVAAAISGAIRGGALLGLGLVLEEADSQIVVVLTWLGLLTWLMTWVARWRTGPVAALALATFVLSPVLLDETRTRYGAALVAGHDVRAWWWEHLTTGSAYRLTAFACWACLGVLASRVWLRRPDARTEEHPGERPSARLLWLPALVALALGLGLFLAQVEGVLSIPKYSGDHGELLLNAGLSIGTLGVVIGLTPLVPRVVAEALAATGAMSLTLYTLQIYASAWAAKRFGADDHYWLMLGSVAASIVLAVAWRRGLGGTRFARGPIEGLVASVVRVPLRMVDE